LPGTDQPDPALLRVTPLFRDLDDDLLWRMLWGRSTSGR
jgi:hypothetical protein